MNYYYLLFYAVIRLVRRLKPTVTDEGLSDGGFWCLNAIAGLYLLFLLPIVGFDSKLALIVSWVPIWIINYWVFLRNERWKNLVARYEAMSSDSLDKHTIVLVGVVVFGWLTLVALWYQKYVPQ